MKSIIKAIFRPAENRHYTNKKTSVVQYAFEFFPVVLICVWGAIFVDAAFWLFLGAVIVYGVIDYMLFDAFFDKLWWKLVWRHFYHDEAQPLTAEQDLLKQYEKNPTPKNYAALQKHLKIK